MNWQPFETAPKDGRQIIVWDGKEAGTAKYVEQFWPGEEHVRGNLYRKIQVDNSYYSFTTDGYPTHWAPVEPPT